MDDHPRITDVAARAGVSPSTVSVVLNAVTGARVTEGTRRLDPADTKAKDALEDRPPEKESRSEVSWIAG